MGVNDLSGCPVAVLRRGFLLLAHNPRPGRRRDEELRPGLRSFPVSEYIILYRIEAEDVLILHVVRDSRKLDALLG